MKKNILFLMAAGLLLIGFAACQKDYVAPGDTDIVDPIVDNSTKKAIERGNFASFVDPSRGSINRTWTIPASAEIISEGAANPSELPIIQVRFDEPGMQEVGLKVEFADAQLNIDTFFPIQVYDFVQAKIEVSNIEADFFEQNPTQITMYEGGAITYADSSAGNPNRRLWLLEGGDPKRVGGLSIDEDKDFVSTVVQYPEIGVYDVTLITWRQFPEGAPDTVVLKDYVNIIKNISPPSVVSVEEGQDSIIRINFNLPMKFSGDLTSNFALEVDGAPVAISDVAVNTADNRVIELTPAFNIDHNSSAVISYDGNGELARINDTKAPAFTGEAIMLYTPTNLLTVAGMDPTFEDGTLNGWNPVLEDANTNPTTVNAGAGFELATEGYGGSSGALLVKLNPNEDLGMDEKNNFRVLTDIANYPLQFEAGKYYIFEFWYKIEGGGGQEMTARFHGPGWPPAIGGGWTSGNSTNGEWKFRKIRWKDPNPEALAEARISLQFISKGNEATNVLLDNMLIYAEE